MKTDAKDMPDQSRLAEIKPLAGRFGPDCSRYHFCEPAQTSRNASVISANESVTLSY